MSASSSVPPSQPPPPAFGQQEAIYHIPPPDESPPAYAPPSYDDATRSTTAPLLVGPPPNYGTYRAYPSPDASSVASSEIEETSRSLPEWVGQALVVMCFVGIIYGFWRLVNEDFDGFPG